VRKWRREKRVKMEDVERQTEEKEKERIKENIG
jgi:hypothetical protein